jgi:DNA repair exonuclease SbcCD ATPase subunit
MDSSTQELMNMLEQMKDKLKTLGMEKVALQKENKKLKKENEQLKTEKEELIKSNDKLLSNQKKEYELIKDKYHEAVDDLEEAQEFIEQVYDHTGNAHDSNEYLAEHISDLEQFSLAYQEQWDAWTEEQIEGDHWVQKSQVVPEQIKKEWKNVWDCLADEEENCYNQEGHDPEVKTAELEDGWTYKSMRVIDDWVKSSE